MLREKLHEYFSFTKKERIGVLTLMALIIIVFILPYFFASQENKNKKQDFEQFRNEIAQLKVQQADSNHYTVKNEDKEEGYSKDYDEPVHKKEGKREAVLFYFDPNTASDADWKRLGLRDKTIRTIQNYISKGGKFRKPDDLRKVYDLYENEYLQLLPFIKIENAYSSDHIAKTENSNSHSGHVRSQKVLHPIDVNDSDTSAFMELPGIGSRLASRIVTFREKLGGFYSIDQIGEIYNLPDSTFQKIRPFLLTGTQAVKKININSADAATLKTHPYVRWNLANAIVQYRSQHGEYKSLDELKQIAIITPEIFDKISNYLMISGK
jgi:DNA uptake protein ComE-like DNA-binding protein